MKYIEIDKLKIFIKKIREKKERIEANYFNTLDILNDVLKSAVSEATIGDITQRKEKLDVATNAAISTLDSVEMKLKKALLEIQNDIENGNWENFDRAMEIVNNIGVATSINPNEIFNNRLDYVKELRDTIERGDDLSAGWKDSEIEEFEVVEKEFNDTMDSINRNFSYEAPGDVKAGLLNDEQYAFEDKLNKLESKLDKEIEKLKVQGDALEVHKDAILEALRNIESGKSLDQHQGTFSSSHQELYFSSLDKAVSNAVEKLDSVSKKMTSTISAITHDRFLNLERISKPLIKSLENTLSNLTTDVSFLREQNENYRREIDRYKQTIDDLTLSNREREIELENSYKSWLESTRKLNDLEEVIMDQSREIQILDDDKNQIISDLEKRILDANDFLTQTLQEKEILMKENEDLLLALQDSKSNYCGGDAGIDEHVDAVSLQDLVEKEANRIVENKMSDFVERYQSEIEKIKSESLNEIILESKNIMDHDGVFDKIITNNEQKEQHDSLNETIKSFEKKISDLEERINYSREIKDRNQKSINDISLLIHNDQYVDADDEKRYLSAKFGELEKKIEESLERVTSLEDQSMRNDTYTLSEQEVNDIVVSSPLYGAMQNQIHGMEKQMMNLKYENERIIEENNIMNSVLDETLQKLMYNAQKMDEIESLLTKQEYEFMILNDEKNNVIETLYSTIKDRDLSNMDDLSNLQSLEKYDFNDFVKRTMDSQMDSKEVFRYVRSEVEKIVEDELQHLKNKYNDELNKINQKYNSYIESIQPEHNIEILFNNNYDIQDSKPNELDNQVESNENNFNLNEIDRINQQIKTMDIDNQPLDHLIKEHEIEINNFNHIVEDEHSQFSINNNDIEQEEEYDKKMYYTPNFIDKNNINDDIEGLDTIIVHQEKEWEKFDKPKISEKFVSESELVELSQKNKMLENKIKELQDIIVNKSNEQMENNKSTTVIFSQTEKIENEIISDLKASQEKQFSEIENKLENSFDILKQEQMKQLEELNKKIDNIKVDNFDSSVESILNKYFVANNSQDRYLEKEILESTDRLLKIQSLLLTLESEITKEEQKVISDL